MDVTVVVPTYHEGPNVAELVRRVIDATVGLDLEILFVDDSSDDTPAIIRTVGASSAVPVRLIHREVPHGGLSGAVVDGLRATQAPWVVVMDGDLQHPPEMIPTLLAAGQEMDADIVVASRYCGVGGDAGGLDGTWRKGASLAAAALARSMFPLRLRNVTDPMTGFFAVRTAAVDLDVLRPQGFKILLEILARGAKITALEVPFVFADRYAGQSKASMGQGMAYLRQLASLRFGKLSGFAVIGAVGAVANVAILGALTALGVHHVPAYIVSSVLTIIANFVLQERFVFADLRNEGKSIWRRFAQSFAFNGAEAAVRLPVFSWIVQATPVAPVLAQAVTIALAFVVRFVFLSRVVYRPQPTSHERTGGADMPDPDGTPATHPDRGGDRHQP